MHEGIKIVVGMLVLIGIYLFLVHAPGATSILTSGGNFVTAETGKLQGR